jgi:peptide/nickel transport system permease protein
MTVATERTGLYLPAVVLALIVGGAVIAGGVGLPSPTATSLNDVLAPPGAPGHILGTDALGRDILARCLYGSRISLIVAISSVGLGLSVGGTLGIIAGYRGGLLDALIMRTMDVLLAFPALILALTVAAYLGPKVQNLIFAIAVLMTPIYVRERDFVRAAILLGSTESRVLSRHVLPHVVGVLVAYALVAAGIAIVVEASLSFLGLGVQPPQPSWGIMIAEGKPDLVDAPYVALMPAGFLFVTLLAINLLADAVRGRDIAFGQSIGER